MTTTDESTAAELDALTVQLKTADAATSDARDELAAATAARGDAVIAGTLEQAHSGRVLDARDRLDLCLEVEQALTRQRRALMAHAPVSIGDPATGDARTVRVAVIGRPGEHSCNQPSTGRHLHGGEEPTLPADDAIALVTGGHAAVIGAVPSWWPHHVPILDTTTLHALSGR